MIVNCLVNYSGVVKVHIMAKLVFVFGNFRIAVANTDRSSMFTKPCGKSSIRLAIICEIAIKAVYFVYNTTNRVCLSFGLEKSVPKVLSGLKPTLTLLLRSTLDTLSVTPFTYNKWCC